MTPAEQLNAIMDVIDGRIVTALGLTSGQLYESRSTGQKAGEAAYVSATIPQTQPLGGCADDAVVEVTIGFMLRDDGRPFRVQRVEAAMKIRDVLLWQSATSPNVIQGVGMPQVTDLAVSALGDPDDGFIDGGLTYRFRTVLQRAT